MADLYIYEAKHGYSGQGSMVAAMLTTPPLATQKIAITGGSTASAAFNALTESVLLVADGACHVQFGAADGSTPTAAATSMLLPANVPLPFGVVGGQKLAVIT